MKRSLFPQADHPIRPTSKLFPFGQSGFNSFMLKQRDQHIAKHQLPMLGMAT
jgi:hypothetical protein